MKDEIEKKKKELKDKLESELYVDRYTTFKESIIYINEALKSFGINYEYNYNDFCSDFTDECLKYIDDHPHIDMTDTRQMMMYTLPIIMKIIEKAKNKYGLINEKINDQNN